LSRGARGFSLIEMMAVLVVIVGVTGVAISGYIDISSQNIRAADLTRDARRATAILDRVVLDLQAASLATKPEERDPLEHPWLFLAEARGSSEGADRLKFVIRGRAPTASQARASDLAQVAWFTKATAQGDLELLRWSFPRLPEGLEHNLPRDDDPGVFLAAEGLESFGVRFMDETGVWTDRWDSSALAHSSQLPLMAEVSVQMAPQDPGGEPSASFVRRMVLPLRPFDLEAQLAGRFDPADEGSKDEEGAEQADCLRVRDCIDASQLGPDLLEIILDLQDQCLEDVGVPPEAILAECQR
jgi:prepilin-type N-terminal cleavage/methylation domain-containing protein